MMNSIEIGIERAGGRAGAVTFAPGTQPPLRRGAVREWLPVPAPALVETPGRKSAPVARSIWIQPEGDSKGEKLFLCLLTSAAVIGIGYGFSCLLDLVQDWAGFHAGIAQLVH